MGEVYRARDDRYSQAAPRSPEPSCKCTSAPTGSLIIAFVVNNQCQVAGASVLHGNTNSDACRWSRETGMRDFLALLLAGPINSRRRSWASGFRRLLAQAPAAEKRVCRFSRTIRV
jgi:hypothetical protein